MENYISMRSLFDENLVKLKGKQKKKMTERHSVEVKKLTNVISNEMQLHSVNHKKKKYIYIYIYI